MSAYELGQLLGTALGGVFGVILVGGFFIGVFFTPYLLWSAARSLKHIRLQLERLNETLESQRTFR